MTANHGRANREANAPTVLLQARVDPLYQDAVNEAARKSGISKAWWMEEFLKRSMDENGKLPVYPDVRRRPDEELPIPAA